MKKLASYTVLLLLLFLMGFQNDVSFQGEYQPIFMLRSNMEENLALKPPGEITNAGKIYLKGDFIFVNEKYRGIHVINNSNPEEPQNIGFISIDGCIDMAVKNDILYADNSVDLVALKYAPDMSAIELTERVKEVFPEPVSPDGRWLSWKEEQARPEDAVLVRWEKR